MLINILKYALGTITKTIPISDLIFKCSYITAEQKLLIEYNYRILVNYVWYNYVIVFTFDHFIMFLAL